MVGRIIHGSEDLAEGVAFLTRADPVMGRVLAQVGDLPLRRRADGFGAILDTIVGQQISTAAAKAIWGRLEAAGMVTQSSVAASEEETLRALGLSRPKARYALAVARAGVDWAALRDLPDGQVIARLVDLPGIGVWSAEIYAMFALGRADVLASGDLALQEAARVAYDLPARPKASELAHLALVWSPWRAVAARGLWAYYRIVTQREGIT